MSKRKPQRDSNGKFTSESLEEEVLTLGEKIGSFWKKLKIAIFVLTVGFLCIPWSVMAMEPAKAYGSLMMDIVKNYTIDLHGNICSCPLVLEKKEDFGTFR
jgi:hypothetical protein